jgi:hypothetical protein
MRIWVRIQTTQFRRFQEGRIFSREVGAHDGGEELGQEIAKTLSVERQKRNEGNGRDKRMLVGRLG